MGYINMTTNSITTYTCKSKKVYQFLIAKGFRPAQRALELRTYLPISIFIVTDELSAALDEWSAQYKEGGVTHVHA